MREVNARCGNGVSMPSREPPFHSRRRPSTRAPAGSVSLRLAPEGRVVLVPGTGFNAAVTLPWLEALSLRWPMPVVDLPGQPGLSDPRRPPRPTDLVRPNPGGGVGGDRRRTGRVGRQLLGSRRGLGGRLKPNRGPGANLPAGFMRLSLDPMAVASSLWLLQPTAEHTRRLLRMFVARVRSRPKPRWSG